MSDPEPVGPPSEAVARADELLQLDQNAPERRVETKIANLLEAFGIRFEQECQTNAARADIFCPDHRILIEVKAPGRATTPEDSQGRRDGETPFAQLERYLLAERRAQLSGLNCGGSRPWIGIVTDGRVWHTWRWRHQEATTAEPMRQSWHPTGATDLCTWIQALEGQEVKQAIPSNPLTVLEPRYRDLQRLFEGRDEDGSLQTKRALWLDMMRAALMAPGPNAIDRLFVTHSFLVAVARGVIATLMDPDAESIEGSVALQEGFVAWVTDDVQGEQWAQALFEHIHAYEWRNRPGDVLRPLYESLVDESDRRVFGEYYTPDWLAELMVREVLDEAWCNDSVNSALVARARGQRLRGIGVLDPACGSGTFLYHAVRRLLACEALKDHSPVRQATVTAMLVHGIDVHPVAAEMARATLLRALPAPPEGGTASLGIFQGDALMAGESGFVLMEAGFDATLIFTPKRRELTIPRSFITSPSFRDDLSVLVKRAAAGETECPEHIIAGIERQDSRRDLREFCRTLRDVIRDEGNSVWAWYIANITGPMLLSHTRVDRVVSNPPWVTMKDIQTEERKRILEDLAANKLKIWTGGRQAPHFDIASLFIRRVRDEYLANREKGVAAWLVKKAALTAGSWKKFREQHEKHIDQQLDLEQLQPFGGGDARRCCVLLEHRRFKELTTSNAPSLVARRVRRRRRPSLHHSLQEARRLFEVVHAAPPVKQGPSAYIDGKGRPVFRNGATLFPRVLVLARKIAPENAISEVAVRTERSIHGPWKQIDPQEGLVPKHWLTDVVLSKQVLPFATLPPSSAVIPRDPRGRLLEIPGQFSEFWEKLESIWAQNRGKGHAVPKTLTANLNYQGKLQIQIPMAVDAGKRLVLYPASGDIMRASRAECTVVVDHTLYRWTASDEHEAAYLVAMLNARCLRVGFKQSRKSGRDIHLRPWYKVPIPRFNVNNVHHAALAELCTEAEIAARRSLKRSPSTMGQVGLSNRIRATLDQSGIYARIDALVARIMPPGVVSPD